MKIHEFQAKVILAQHGVPIPKGFAVSTVKQAEKAARDLGSKAVVKAQIHAGGRGKGRLVANPNRTAAMYAKLEADPAAHEGRVKGSPVGGVRLVNTPAQAAAEARKILGRYLVSHQTGPQGRKVRRLLIEEQSAVTNEYYASVLIDNALGAPVMIASAEGGQAIEEIAERNPAAIIRLPIDPTQGFPPFRGRQLAKQLGMPKEAVFQAGQLFAGLYGAFVATDALLAEINPCVLTQDNRVLALDAKVNLDDNAAFRQRYQDWRDLHEEDPMEIKAEQAGIGSYVKLDGNIGCMVNGAGLAMATLDTIMLAGGEPANFLDIGTVNRVERVVEALHIIHLDPAVKAILINIFGGMARADIIAEGIVQAHRKFRIKTPIVVRLAGSNIEQGRQILDESGIDLIQADNLGLAAQKAAAAAAA